MLKTYELENRMSGNSIQSIFFSIKHLFLKLIAADQVMPVPFIIRCKMTNDTMLITPGKVNFGKLYDGSASR